MADFMAKTVHAWIGLLIATGTLIIVPAPATATKICQDSMPAIHGNPVDAWTDTANGFLVYEFVAGAAFEPGQEGYYGTLFWEGICDESRCTFAGIPQATAVVECLRG